MNLRTTIVLIVLAALGLGGWWVVDHRLTAPSSSALTALLDKDVATGKLTRIELSQNGRTIADLTKVDGVWTLPGKWPVRDHEVDKLVKALTALHSRFTPEEVLKKDLPKYGLTEADAVVAKLTIDGKVVTLKFGEEPAEQNRFTRATYVQKEGADEVVRLGPGVAAELKHAQEYYQQRRLFPVERVAKEDDGQEKIEQAAVKAIRITGPDGTVALAKEGNTWKITDPTKDHVDPDKLRNLLVGLTDLFADRFVVPGKKLEEMGLNPPEYKVSVSRIGGGETTLMIGKISESREIPIIKPAPPQSPFGPPPKPNVTFVKEEYRFAKLPENDQLFEIRTDKLKDVTAALADLRDPRLARFKTDDVKKITIDHDGKTIDFVKDKEKWKIEGASPLDAESGPVSELLDKLAGLEAKGGDIRDKVDLKEVGLEKPAVKIRLELEETKKTKADGETKETKVPRTLVYELGTSAKEKGKTFVQLVGLPRVNAFGDDLLKLAEREAVGYRNRRVMDIATTDLGSIKVAKGKEEFTLERKDGDWTQTKPAPVKIDVTKVAALAADLARLETTEYVTATPKAEDLDKTYGLASPTATVTLGFSDAKKPAKTLTIGKARPFKDDYYARLDDGPVMLLKKETVEAIEKDATMYRPSQAWQVTPSDVAELRISAEDSSYTLKKKDADWQISGPFEATVKSHVVEPMLDDLSHLKSEKYLTVTPKDGYGFEKPYLQAIVISRQKVEKKQDDLKKDDAKATEPKKEEPKVEAKKDDKKEEKKDEFTETTQTLIVGKLDESGKNRYAKVGDIVFLIGDKALASVDHSPLALLDKSLLDLDPAAITQIRFQGEKAYTLDKQKDKEEWKVDRPEPFVAEDSAVKELLRIWPRMTATKIVAYGPKIDWAEFGLAQPKETVVVSLIDKDKKAVEHTIALGKELKDERFARIDQQQAVVVLNAAVTREMTRGPLDYLDPRLLKFGFDAVAGIERSMKDGDVELTKNDDGWQLVKPAKQAADSVTADDILEKTFQLKAKRIDAYKTKDLAPYGLDKPAAVVTIKLTDGKKHVLAIGSAAKDHPDERYIQVDGGDKIGLLGPELSKHLTAPPLYFADRNLAGFGAADRIDVTFGSRKLVFVKTGTTWKLADPVKASAEDSLADFVKILFRLRADEIVAGKDADLKTYGLDHPEAEIKVMAGDRDMLDLLVGGIEKGHEKDVDPRRYGKLAKGDQVFLMSPALSKLALSEYRSRKPWEPPLDAAQIDQLAVTGPAGPFTLTKKGSDWSFVGQPDAANAKTVTDALDALTGLRVDRYVADAKGDLQLYGLATPEWKLEVKTPSGSRTLLVGRAEGESHRRYGAIAGQDAVFTIAAEDVERLTRPAASYREEKK